MEEPKYNKPDYNNPNIKPVVFDLSEIDKKLSPAQLMPQEQIKARELQSEVSAKQSKLQSYNYPTYMVDKLGNAFKPNFDNIDLKYKELLQAENDAKAEAQSWYGNLGRGLGNILNTAVTGILSVPGYIGAMVEAAVTDKTIGETTDNAWINFFEETKKTIGENAFKTYVPSDVSEGGLWSKMSSGSWWATTGADGIGNLIQFMVPGAALKGLSLGSKFAKGTRLTKLFTDEAKVGKFLKNADDFTAAAFNASLESSMEAHESFKNIYGQLKSKVDSGVMTDKEAREIAGEQSSKVFMTNMAILSISNMIDQKWLFGGTANGSYIEKKLANALSEEAVKPAGKKWYSMIPSAVGTVGKGFVKEGFLEEGTQFATQKYFENRALNKNEDPNWITGIIGEYYDGMMNSDEFAESVFLGGVLGSPLSIIGKVNEKKFEKEFLYGRNASNPGALKRFMGVRAQKSSEGILKILKDNYMNNFTEHTDIFEKDEKGNVKLDKNNKPIITPAKRAKLIMDLLAKDVNKMDMVFAKAVGDDLLFESKRDESLYNFMRPYFAVDGGRQVFEQHIDRIAEQEKKNLESLGDTRSVENIKTELKEKYMTFQNQFMRVSNSMNSTNKLTKEQKKATPEFDALLTNVTMMHYLDQTNLKKAIDKVETEITELERSPLQLNQKLAEPLKKRKAKLEESLKNSEEQALKFMTKEGQNELLDRYLKRQQEGAEAIVQTEAEEDINASAQTIKSIDHANVYRQGTIIDPVTNVKYHGGVTITNEEGQSYQADIIGLENGELKVRDKSGKEFTIKTDGTINGIPVTVKNSYAPKVPKKTATTEVVDSTEEVNQEEAFNNSAKRAYKEEPHPVFTGNITDFFRTKGFQEMYQKNPEKYKPYLEFYKFIDNYNEEVDETSSEFRTLKAHTLNTLPANIKKSLSKELLAELAQYPNSILLVVMNGKTPILQNGSYVMQLLPEPLLYGDVETIDREERYPLFSYDKFREAYGDEVTDEIITATLQKNAERFTEFRQRIIESPEPINFRILDKNQGVLVIDSNMEFTSVVGKLVATKEEIYAVDIQISKNKIDEGIVYFKHKGAKIPANREKLSNADIKRVVNLMKYYVTATSATDRENAFQGLKTILHIVYQSKGQKTPGKFTFFPTKSEKGEITGFKYGEWSISKEDLLADNTDHLEGKFLQDKFYSVDKKSLEGYNQAQDFYAYDVKDGKLVTTLYKIEDGGYKKYLLAGDKPKLTVKIKPLGDTQFLSRSFNIDPINLPIPKMTEEEIKIVQEDIKTPIVETDEFDGNDFAPGEEPTVDAKADIEKDQQGNFVPKKYTLNLKGENPAPNIPLSAISEESFGGELPTAVKQVKLLEIRGKNSLGQTVGEIWVQKEDGQSYTADVIFNNAELATLEQPVNIETKKADIERRRQESLNAIKQRPNETLFTAPYYKEGYNFKQLPTDSAMRTEAEEKEYYEILKNNNALTDVSIQVKTREEAEKLINAKYDAELNALEGKSTTTTTTSTDIEAKKADIERKRQEELEELNKERLESIIFNIKFKDGNKVKDLFPNFSVDDANILAETGFKDSLTKQELDAVEKYRTRDLRIKSINAKYDAELAALEGKPSVDAAKQKEYDKIDKVFNNGNQGTYQSPKTPENKKYSDYSSKGWKIHIQFSLKDANRVAKFLLDNNLYFKVQTDAATYVNALTNGGATIYVGSSDNTLDIINLLKLNLSDTLTNNKNSNTVDLLDGGKPIYSGSGSDIAMSDGIAIRFDVQKSKFGTINGNKKYESYGFASYLGNYSGISFLAKDAKKIRSLENVLETNSSQEEKIKALDELGELHAESLAELEKDFGKDFIGIEKIINARKSKSFTTASVPSTKKDTYNSPDSDALFKVYNPSDITGVTPEAIKEFKKKFKGFDLRFIGNGLINGIAVAAVTKNMEVIISDFANDGTLNHEAFHIVSQFFTSKKTRGRLYNETRKRLGKPGMTNLEAEEFLADEYEQFMENPNTYKFNRGQEVKKSVFTRIWNAIKSFFGVQTVEEMFKKIANTNYSKADIINKPSDFNYLYKIKGLDESTTMKLIKHYNVLFFDRMHYDKGFSGVILDLNADKINKIYDSLRDAIKSSDKSENKVLATYLREVENHHKKYLNQYGFSLEFERPENEQYIESNKISQLVDMPSAVKLLIAGLSKKERGFNYGTFARTADNFSETVDFDATLNILNRELANLPEELIFPKLAELYNERKHPEFKTLLDRLGVSLNINTEVRGGLIGVNKVISPNATKHQVQLQTMFLNTFTQNLSNPLMAVVSRENPIIFVDQSADTMQEKILAEWKSNLRGSGNSYFTYKNGKFLLDTTALYRMPNGIKVPILEVSKQGDINKLFKRYSDIADYLAVFGITITDNQKSRKLGISIIQNLSTNLAAIEAPTLDDVFNKDTGKINKELKALAIIELTYSKKNVSNQNINGKGQTEYSISLPNKLSHVIADNKYGVSNDYEPYSESNPNGNLQTVHHTWDYNNLDLVLLRSVKADFEDAQDIDQSKKGDFIVTEVNAVLSGINPFLRAADRGLEYAFRNSTTLNNDFKITTIQMVEDLIPYLENEIIIALAYQNDPKAKHFVKSGKTANDLQFFKDIIPSLKVEGIADKSNYQEVAKNIIKENINIIKSSIGKYVDSQIKETLNLFSKWRLVDITENVYTNNGFSNDILGKLNSERILDKAGLEQLARTFSHLYIKSGLDQMKHLMGNLSTYNKGTTSELHKRTTLNAATKQATRNSQEFNEYLNKYQPRIDGFEHTKLQRNWVIQDQEVSSYLLDQMKELEISGYDKMTENDAQGLSSLDGYKSLMLRSKEGWNDKKENTYQYEMQFFVYNEIYNNPKYKNQQKRIDAIFKENLPEGWKGVPMIKGVPIKIEDMESLTVLKPQGVGVIQNEGFKTFGQISHTKTSVAPILYSNVKDSKLKDLLVEMFVEGIDFVFPKSAKKGDILGNANGELPSLYDEKGEIKSITESIAEGYQVENLLWNDMGIQLEIDPSGKKKVKQSIQQEAIKSVNVFDKGINVEGKEDLKKLVATDKELKDLRKERLFNQLVIDLGLTKVDGKWEIEFPEKFEKVIAGEFSRKNYSQNTFQAIKEVLYSQEKNFDTINVSDKVDNLLNSLVNNNIISQKVKGDMMIQQASTGYETSNRNITKSNFLKSYEIERDEDGNITKVNPAECMIPLPKEWIKLVNKEEGKNFNEKLDKFNKKIQSKNWDKILTFNSNRTPTQDLNSMEVMRVHKFLVPWSGSTIIVPTEIVVKAGSDFDVDKLSAYLNSYKFDEEGNPIYLDEGDVSSRYEAYVLDALNKARKEDINAYQEAIDTIEDDIKQELNYLKNKNKTWDKVSVDEIKEKLKERKFDLILEDFNLTPFAEFEKLSKYEQMSLDQIDNIISQNTMAFILHPSNYKSLMSPNGSDIINNAVEKIVKPVKQEKRNLHELMSFKKNMEYGFAQWKASAVLGSAANNVSFHSKVQQSPITLNEDLVLLSFENVSNSLGNISNEAEELISTLLAQYVTAAVDAAKESEPALTRANISPSTANLALMLTALRVKPEHIVKFLTDKDILAYELQREIQEAKFLQVQDKQKRKSDIIESLTGYDKKQQKGMMHNVFLNQLRLELDKSPENRDSIIRNKQLLKNIYEVKFAKGPFVENKLEYFLYLTEIAKIYGELIQLTKHDSGMPKNRDAVAYREERLNDLIESNVFKDIEPFFNNTFMGKFREMHLKGTELFNDFFTRTSDNRFAGFLFDMVQPYKDAKVKEDTLMSIQRKLTKKTIAYIIHNSPTNTIKDKYSELLTGDNSLAKRLLKLKNSDNPIRENAFIQELVPVIEEYIDRRKENLEFDYIRKFSSKLSTYEEDTLADSFKEIMESSDENIRQLGSDIIYASIIQSGLNKSNSAFFDTIPVEYFYPIASEALKQFKDSDLDILDEQAKESIYQNSWMDKDIVRKQNSFINNKPIFNLDKSTIAIAESHNNANFEYLTVEYKHPNGAKEIFLYKKGELFDDGDQRPYFKYRYNRIDKKGDGNKFAEFTTPNQLSMINGNNITEVQTTTTENTNSEVEDEEFEKPSIDMYTETNEFRSTQPSTSVEVISEDYGIVQAETNPTNIEKKADIDLIKNHISKQTFKENVGQYANQMFHYSLRWGRKSYNFFVLKDGKYVKSTLSDQGSQLYSKDRNGSFIKSNRTDKAAYNNGLLNPLDIDSFAGKSDMYGYDLVDQNGNPLPSIKDLQPIIDKIETAIGINMKDYDSVIGNIYLPGEYVYPHKDTSESKSARNYPVIVYSIGNDAGLGIVDNNKGKMTFANQYDERFLPENDKLKGYTNEILTKHGSIYTFGMDGKGRFELTHSTPINSKKDKPQTPIMLPNGKIVTNYTITLTFRRAADLKAGIPTSPAKLKVTQPQATVSTENNPSEYTNHSGGAIGSDTQWDVIGKEFSMVNNKHYFTGEKGPKNAPLGNVDITDKPIAIEGASKVAQAAKQMWGYKYNTMKDQRLIRNWAQVVNSDAVFAIGTLGKEGDIWKGDEKSAEPRKLLKVAVQGGTGYAVEMAIQAGKPVYVFDQIRNQWYKNINGKWSKSEVPTLTKNFAGIGTREINDAGKQAIRDVYANTFKSTTQPQTTKVATTKPNIPIKIKKDAKSNWNLELTQDGKVINVNTGQEVDEKTKNKALTKHAFQTGFGTKFSYNNTDYAAIITNSQNSSLSEFKIVSLSESNMGGEVFKQGTPQYNKIIKDNNNVVELLQKICSL